MELSLSAFEESRLGILKEFLNISGGGNLVTVLGPARGGSNLIADPGRERNGDHGLGNCVVGHVFFKLQVGRRGNLREIRHIRAGCPVIEDSAVGEEGFLTLLKVIGNVLFYITVLNQSRVRGQLVVNHSLERNGDPGLCNRVVGIRTNVCRGPNVYRKNSVSGPEIKLSAGAGKQVGNRGTNCLGVNSCAAVTLERSAGSGYLTVNIQYEVDSVPRLRDSIVGRVCCRHNCGRGYKLTIFIRPVVKLSVLTVKRIFKQSSLHIQHSIRGDYSAARLVVFHHTGARRNAVDESHHGDLGHGNRIVGIRSNGGRGRNCYAGVSRSSPEIKLSVDFIKQISNRGNKNILINVCSAVAFERCGRSFLSVNHQFDGNGVPRLGNRVVGRVDVRNRENGIRGNRITVGRQAPVVKLSELAVKRILKQNGLRGDYGRGCDIRSAILLDHLFVGVSRNTVDGGHKGDLRLGNRVVGHVLLIEFSRGDFLRIGTGRQAPEVELFSELLKQISTRRLINVDGILVPTGEGRRGRDLLLCFIEVGERDGVLIRLVVRVDGQVAVCGQSGGSRPDKILTIHEVDLALLMEIGIRAEILEGETIILGDIGRSGNGLTRQNRRLTEFLVRIGGKISIGGNKGHIDGREPVTRPKPCGTRRSYIRNKSLSEITCHNRPVVLFFTFDRSFGLILSKIRNMQGLGFRGIRGDHEISIFQSGSERTERCNYLLHSPILRSDIGAIRRLGVDNGILDCFFKTLIERIVRIRVRLRVGPLGPHAGRILCSGKISSFNNSLILVNNFICCDAAAGEVAAGDNQQVVDIGRCCSLKRRIHMGHRGRDRRTIFNPHVHRFAVKDRVIDGQFNTPLYQRNSISIEQIGVRSLKLIRAFNSVEVVNVPAFAGQGDTGLFVDSAEVNQYRIGGQPVLCEVDDFGLLSFGIAIGPAKERFTLVHGFAINDINEIAARADRVPRSDDLPVFVC